MPTEESPSGRDSGAPAMDAPVTVIIPVYNGSQTLPALAARLDAVLALHSEVIFVDDASPDDSWRIIKGIVECRSGWSGIQLGRNSGQHGALLAGIRAAHHDTIVTMDDDLQHRPEDLPALVGALGADTDLVYGVSRIEEHDATRSLASRLVKRMMARSLRVPYASDISALRCFRADLRGGFAQVNDPYVSIDVLLSWSTNRVAAVEVDMDARTIGASGYTLRRLIRHTANMVTGYSVAPLRLVAIVGLVFGMLGFGSLAYVVGRWALGGASVPGFTFLAALLSLIGGTQMLAVAVIGEYLGHVHFRTMQRPSYVVRTVVDGRSV